MLNHRPQKPTCLWFWGPREYKHKPPHLWLTWKNSSLWIFFQGQSSGWWIQTIWYILKLLKTMGTFPNFWRNKNDILYVWNQKLVVCCFPPKKARQKRSTKIRLETFTPLNNDSRCTQGGWYWYTDTLQSKLAVKISDTKYQGPSTTGL